MGECQIAGWNVGQETTHLCIGNRVSYLFACVSYLNNFVTILKIGRTFLRGGIQEIKTLVYPFVKNYLHFLK